MQPGSGRDPADKLVLTLQVGIIGADHKFRVLTDAEVQDYLQEVE